MARKGMTRQIKRVASPRNWQIKRKVTKWIAKTHPGPHSIEQSLPLALIVRDLLGYARTMREVKQILREDKVKIDGKIRRDPHFPVGLMDTIEFVPSGEFYRMIPKSGSGFKLVKISSEESKIKLCRIVNKTMTKGGLIQLNLHDGRNILLTKERLEENPDLKTLRTKDVVKIQVPEQNILDFVKFEIGSLAFVFAGKNVGKTGKLVEYEIRFGPHASVATLQSESGELFQTALDYVFVIGKESPIITLE